MFEDRCNETILLRATPSDAPQELRCMVLHRGFSRNDPEDSVTAEHIFLLRSPVMPSPGAIIFWQNRQWHIRSVREIRNLDGALAYYRCQV